MDVTNYAQLFAQIEAAAKDVLQKEMADAVKEKISEKADEDIYNRYPYPNQYPRRRKNGGISDVRQMNHTVDGLTLEVTDDADFNREFATEVGWYGGVDLSKSLAYNLNFGYGDDEWSEPSHFIDDARNELASSGEVREIMRKGLQERLGEGSVTVT